MISRIVGNFWKWIIVWTVAGTALFVGVGVMTIEAYAPLRTAPVWLGMALVLAAYPAGIATAAHVWEEGRFSLERLAVFAGAAISVSVVAFVLANGVAPRALSPDPVLEATSALSLTLGELRDSLHVLSRALPTEPSDAEAWLPYNHLAYHYVRRTDGMLLPALFAWVGLFVGYWSAGIHEALLRRLPQWGLGAFLLVSTYFAGENGYEMIVLRSAGRAEFVADLVLIVPGTLLIGLGVATVAHAWRAGEASPE